MNILDIFIKKRKSFDDISQRELPDIFIKINSIKRKSLNKNVHSILRETIWTKFSKLYF